MDLGIETRSRSRSKTPGILFGENGDSESGKKGAKKIPTISLIEEEDIAEVQQSSQRPKRQRRSQKAVTSDTSGGDVESPKNSQSKTTVTSSSSSSSITTTTTTVITAEGQQKSVTNGSEEKNDAPATNNINASEVPENQSIFNNIFNAIKTSTPILSSKRTKRVTEEVKSSTSLSPPVDLKAHPAYKEYKEAGEYWNKYPKTDYTYSELSPHRRNLGSGIVNMPNLSRRSLEKHQERVETLIQGNPTEESFLRRKFLTNTSFQKRSANLQYDSADEVDVSDLHLKLASRRRTQQTNFLYRFYLLIVTAFSSAYSSARQGVRKIFYYRPNKSSTSSYTYTPVKNYGQSGTQRFFNAIQKVVLLFASKIYLFISTILCFDTWLLYSRSTNVVENKKRKRFLLGLLILLPLLLFGGTYIYLDPPRDISFPKITLPSLPKITLPSLPKITLPSLPKITFPKISLPSITMPELSWPSWLTFSFSLPNLPSFSISWPTWLALPALPALAWPAWLTFSMPEFSLPSLPTLSWPSFLTFSLPEFSLPSFNFSFDWLKLPSFSFDWFEWPSLSFDWLALPTWFKLPSFSFNFPEISYPSWLKWPEISFPSISFEFMSPVTTYTAETFESLKSSSFEFCGKVRDATFGFLNEAQIVWSENFNSK